MHRIASIEWASFCALPNYNTAATREEQLAQLDTLISAWGATAEMGTLQNRAAAHYTFTYGFDAQHQTQLAAIEAFTGSSYFKMSWEGASFGDAANDEVFEMRTRNRVRLDLILPYALGRREFWGERE